MPWEQELTGLQKAAVLMISLGPELSALLMKQLSQEDIEQISSTIANTPTVSPEQRKEVIEEFLQLDEAQQYILRGGVKYAREVLEKTLGPQKATEIIRKLTESSKIRPFTFVRKSDPKQILNFINNEHPQVIALILSYLEPEQASVILSNLSPEQRVDIARRIATMERASPEVVREVETVLERKLSTVVGQDFAVAGGIQALVNILNRADRSTEKSILETLEQEEPELAEEIRKRLFVFEDIITLDNSAIQRILREVDLKDLTYALKGASEEVKERIFRNMSSRAGEMLREDMEALGPVRLREVEAAQQRIVQIIRNLDEAGEIIISRGGEDAIIV